MNKLKSNLPNLSNLILMKRLVPYYKKFTRTFFTDLIFVSLKSCCDLLFPIIFKLAMDAVDQSKPSLPMTLTQLGIIYVLMFVIELVGTYYVDYIGHSMGAKMEAAMRHDLFARCQKFPVPFYDESKIGHIMSRLTSDLFEIGEFAHHCPEDILIISLKVVISSMTLFRFNWKMSLLIYAIIPVLCAFVVFFFKRMKIANHESKVQLGELTAKIEDSLLGIRLVKSFANEHFEQKNFDKQNNKNLQTRISFYKAFGSLRTANRFFFNAMYVVVIFFGMFLIVTRQAKTQDIITYLWYVGSLVAAASKFMLSFDMYQKGLTGVERFCEVMDLPVETHPNTKKIDISSVKGEVEFKNVEFSYKKTGAPVLKNFNLKIKPNEKIAIVGATGSGKTTICNLLKNFYTVQKGEILIDNININLIDPSCLHEIVGFVQQNVYMFNGTILDNIKYGKLDASFEEVVEATKKAKIFDFINSIENKFNAQTGERGTKLSGGQKQQISIARLFLKNPKILILDEATSSLDSENEKTILAALNELTKNKTTITIAHKLNTIKTADVIYLIENGTIVESGTHETLLENKSSRYNKYYNNFFA